MRRPAFPAFCSACAIAFGFLSSLNLASANDTEPGPPVVRNASDIALSVDAETLERQYRALSSMPSVKVAYSALGPVQSIRGATGIVLSGPTRNLQEGQDGSEVLQKFKDVLLATGTETLKVRSNVLRSTRRTLRMDQFIGGIPVLHGSVSVQIEDATGVVEVLGAEFLPDRGLLRQPKLSEAEAKTILTRLLVERGMAKPGSIEVSAPTLAYVGASPDSTGGHLIWAVPASFSPAVAGAGAGDGLFWLDAADGKLLGSEPLSRNALSVYTASNVQKSLAGFPGNLTLLFNHPGSSTDQLAMNAYNNILDTLPAVETIGSYLQTRPLGLIVHYGVLQVDAENAGYSPANGGDYLRFGDGWAPLAIGPLGNSRDVVAHEYGHGVARFLFDPQRGEDSDAQGASIDEGFGDVVAALVDTYKRGGVPNPTATWTIAEVFTNNPTRGMRSMSNPKSMDITSRDWFPARLLGPDIFSSHENSTIMTHAFKLLATGGFHARAGLPIGDSSVPGNIPSLFVPSLGPATTWDIFFHTFNDPTVTTSVKLPIVKTAAVANANLFYGSVAADAVDRAFRAVGVGVGCTAAPQPPTLDATDRCNKYVLRWPVVPGATTYHGQMNPTVWGWVNALTIVDGDVNQCTRPISTTSQARVRACNGCGCSAWSNIVELLYWQQCP